MTVEKSVHFAKAPKCIEKVAWRPVEPNFELFEFCPKNYFAPPASNSWITKNLLFNWKSFSRELKKWAVANKYFFKTGGGVTCPKVGGGMSGAPTFSGSILG